VILEQGVAALPLLLCDPPYGGALVPRALSLEVAGGSFRMIHGPAAEWSVMRSSASAG
jgi:hypothetical protein